MPYVNIKIARKGVTAEQKEALMAGVTKLLVDTSSTRTRHRSFDRQGDVGHDNPV
jgi:4-oxalocrotonate tautomerase family enzyme